MIPTAKTKLLTDCPFLRGKITDEVINLIAISMKEFAELHRQTALRAALINVDFEDYETIEEHSILSSYPPENIK